MSSAEPPSLEERIAARLACSRWLSEAARPHVMAEQLAALAEAAPDDPENERYGSGQYTRAFEREIAELLGTEAAVFMPSGTMAQPIALRIWCDEARVPRVGFHPTCHLELHEHRAYAELHGLHATLLGGADRLMTLEDLEGAPEPLGALLIELPQREIGGELPAWDALVALTDRARERGIRLHCDGARLWECAPWYGRSVAEIAALFDSVYVSFYKTLGAIAGAALAGPASFIAQARIWQRRQGGNLVYLYPYVVSARRGVETRLPEVPRYVDKARRVAATLVAIDGVDVHPSPPPTNHFLVYFGADRAALLTAGYEVARETGVWLFSGLQPAGPPGTAKTEIAIGPGALEIPDEELAELVSEVMRRARRWRGPAHP